MEQIRFCICSNADKNLIGDRKEKKKRMMHPYFHDDGSEYNPDLFPLPQLCMSCKKKEIQKEEVPCNMNRMDQVGKPEFQCGAYERQNH